MKAETYTKATELLQRAKKIDEQRKGLERTNPKTLQIYNGNTYICIGSLFPDLAQNLLDLAKLEFDRQAKRIEDEFAALQDEPDRPECPQPRP